MTASAPESQAVLRAKERRSYILGAFLLGTLAAYACLTDTFQPLLAGALLVWSMGFGMLGWGVRNRWFSTQVMSMISGLIALVCVTIILHLTGGPRSLYFPMLGGLPLTIALTAPQTRALTLTVTVMTLLTVALLEVLSGMPAREMGMQLSGFVLLGAVAVTGLETYQRMRAAEEAAQLERMKALDQLAQSEQRRAHAERERSEVERLALVGQLASGVSHEVNNPLAYVKSNLHFLKEELRRPDERWDAQELLQVIDEAQQGVLRIQRIVMDLRSFARMGHGPDTNGRPESALHEARRLVSVRMGGLGEVALDLPPELPEVRLGQRHLVQVLVNLLLNAADAVEGAVPARRAHIQVKGRRMGDAVRLEVEDNGPGIPEELLPRIFEPFFTTRQPGEGTGLGLALCREYVSRAGGTLQAENRPEGGARFILVLPGGA